MSPFNDPFGDAMFTIVPSIIFIGFIVMFIIIISMIVKGIGSWSHNNSQPRLTVLAKIISKRTNVSSHMNNDVNDNFSHQSTDTTYYVAFEVESGNRMEFHVSGSEFGLFLEGDKGRISFQGTRYLGFQRIVDK